MAKQNRNNTDGSPANPFEPSSSPGTDASTNALQAPPASSFQGEPGSEPGAGEAVEMTPEQEEARDRAIFRQLSGGASSEPEGDVAGEAGRRALEIGELGLGPDDDAPSNPFDAEDQAPLSLRSQAEPARAHKGGVASDAAEVRRARTIAHAAMRRDGYPPQAIERALEGLKVDELRAMTEKIRNRQGEVDRLGNQVYNQPKAGEKAAPSHDDYSDLPEKIRASVELLEDGGNDAAARDLVDSWRAQAGSAATQQTQGSSATINDVRQQLRGPLDRLAMLHPDMGSDAERDRIIEIAWDYMESGVFDGPDWPDFVPFEDMLAKAAEDTYGAPGQPAAQRQLAKRVRHEANGQMTPPARTAPRKPAAAMTEEEIDREAFRQLREGRRPDDVNKFINSLRGQR